MANVQSKDSGDKWRKVAFVVAHREKVRRVAEKTANASGASTSETPFKACISCRKYNKSFVDNLLIYTADVYSDFVSFNDEQIAILLNKMSGSVPKLPFCVDCWKKWHLSNVGTQYVEPTAKATTSKRRSSSCHPTEPVDKKPKRKAARRQVKIETTSKTTMDVNSSGDDEPEIVNIMAGKPTLEDGELSDVKEEEEEVVHTELIPQEVELNESLVYRG